MRVLIIFLAFVFLSLTAQAEEKRIALLIGNNDYPASVGRLTNTHNDVGKLKASLQSVGFEVITELDRDEDGMMRAVSSFTSRVDSEAGKGNKVIAFFYYAGHGVSVNKEGMQKNYLLPARETISSRFDLFSKGIDLGDVISAFSATKASAFFVVSDACRNELGVTFSRSVGSRGFNVMPQRPGMLIAYSTAAGATAPDDGKFASILADKIKTPGVRAEVSFIDALADISVERGLNDRPFMSAGRLPRDFCFAGCKMGDEDRDWLYTKEIDVISGYEFFLRKYPSGKFATDAHAAIARLKNSDTDFIPNPEPSPKPTPKPNPETYYWNEISASDWLTLHSKDLLTQTLSLTTIEAIQSAANMGDKRAARLIGEAYFKGGYGVSKNFSKARQYNEYGCDQAETSSCVNLGLMYRDGSGVSQNYKKAAALFKKGCDGGNAIGCTSLGYLHRTGYGVSKSKTAALDLYLRGCNGGDVQGCYNVGAFYETGYGVSKSINIAKSYYQKACDGGHERGCRSVAFWNKATSSED